MEIKRFTGIRNVTSEERLKVGELLVASDLELDNTGKLLSRRGYTRVSATGMHSLYDNGQVTLAASGSSLKLVAADFSTTTLADLQSSTLPVSYESVGDVVYWSNGLVRGRIVGGVNRAWGVSIPAGQPAAVPIVPGSLAPGRYLYAMTFLRSDGHESGTGVAGSVDVSEGYGGIQFTEMEDSTNPLVSGKILYLSGANGETMFKVADLPAGKSAISVTQNRGTVPLMTQHAGPPPPGSIVRYFNGSMYVVAGDTVYRSDPYELELFRKDTSYLRFPGELAMFECVNDGIYVATLSETWYLAGADPAKSIRVFDHGAVPGTPTKTSAGFLESPIEGEAEGMQGKPAVVWVSRFGICAGFDGGVVRNYTEAKYSLPSAQRGAGTIRQDRGFVQYVAALQGVGDAVNAYTRG